MKHTNDLNKGGSRMRTYTVLALFLWLVACNDSGGGGGSTAAKAVVTPPGTSPSSPVPPSGPANDSVDLTYYSVTQTIAPLGASDGFWNLLVTFTASCVQYLGKTYCWDNGIQMVSVHAAGWFVPEPFSFSYWGVSGANPALNFPEEACYGDCQVDLMVSPTLVDPHVTALMADALGTVANMMANGTAKQVACTDDGATLDCVDFQVDLTQAPL